MKKRAKISLALLLAAMMLLFTACGGGENGQGGTANSGNAGQGNGESASGNEGSGEQVELTFWNIWTDPTPQNEANLAQVESFMQENPNIVIDQQNIPHDQYKVKVKTQAAGKQLPDLIQVWPGAELKPLVSGGLVQPIDDIVSHWDGLINPGQLRDYQIDGHQYAIPANKTPTSLVYYDKDMLAEAGYEKFPETYEEFKQLVQALKETGTIPIALGNKAQWVLQSSYISTIGDRLTGSDFLPSVLNGEGTFTDEKFVRAIGIIKELADMGAFNEDFNSIDNNQHRELFILGEAAMMIDGAWSLGPVVDEVGDEKNIGIALFPAVDGGEGDPGAVSAVTGTGIAINSELEGDKLEAAKAFLKGFYTEELYTNLMKAEILVPANIEPPEGVSELWKRVSELSGGQIAPVYDATLPTHLTDIINAGLQEVTLGVTTPEELAQKMQDALDQ